MMEIRFKVPTLIIIELISENTHNNNHNERTPFLNENLDAFL